MDKSATAESATTRALFFRLDLVLVNEGDGPTGLGEDTTEGKRFGGASTSSKRRMELI
jgi:hypothetical protein